MFDADVNSLFDDPSVDKFVDTDTNSTLGNVENNSGASVVTLVWHTLVNGGVGENVNVVSNLDLHQVLREIWESMLAKFLREHMTRTRPGSE